MPKIANNVAASEGDPKQLSQKKTEKSLKKGIRSETLDFDFKILLGLLQRRF